MANNYSHSDILNLYNIHGQCDKIISRTCRQFNETYPDLPSMNPQKFRRLQSNFVRFGSRHAERTLARPITSNENNEINVLAYFYANPNHSIRSAAADLDISYSSIRKILVNHKFHNFKFTTVQELYPEDPQRRTEFCEMILIRTQEDPQFLEKIIWTDEAKFSKEGIFNRRNSHFWGNQNPHVMRPRNFQYKFSFNVFCLLMGNKLCYHIYDENLNGPRYLEILRTVVTNFLDNLPVNQYFSCWYQLDGAPSHCSRPVSNELDQMFDDRWIRRLGPWIWPARSPDLTPMDFYLWGRIKSEVYRTPVTNREELLDRVQRAFEGLDPNEIRSATTHAVNNRILKCLEVNGEHIEQYN